MLEVLKRLHFRFAARLADTPHQYVRRSDGDEEGYVLLWHSWKKFGLYETWNGPKGPRRYKYLYPGDGFKYWGMSNSLYPIGGRFTSKIINRTRVEDPEGYFAKEIEQAAREVRSKPKVR